MCACVKKKKKIKSQQCSMTEKKSEWPNHIRSTAHAQIFMENNIFLYDVFFTFYTQFLSGWWTVLRELTKKKKCILFFWESSTDWLNKIC